MKRDVQFRPFLMVHVSRFAAAADRSLDWIKRIGAFSANQKLQITRSC